uniref:RNA helicase n=1 Tax=Aegilops tauschii subsp. strangulata TaxID=200361 RepID=A0A453NR38_AEGTS
FLRSLCTILMLQDTGSGKTASFLVPIIAHCSRRELQQSESKRGPLAIVLAPTRELCLQVEDQAKVLGKGLPFKTALVVGGDPLAQQIYRIENGVELIVGTPGRLIDLLMKHNVDLTDVSVFVLDEVDCLLERGFRDQAMQIFRALSCPQVMMFSATIHPEIEKLSNSLLNNMIHISCGNPGKPNKSVRQVVIWVESKQKKQKIFEIIKRVLGRGMDLVKVHQVILFDMPNSIDEYIHQVGRASRMGKEGVAIVFVNEEDRKLFGELAQVLKTAGAPIPRELSNSKFTSSVSLGTDRKRKLSSRAHS